MFLDFNQLARIAKFVALFAFFLPWVTVSCSNTEILHATGWQLMIGDPQPAGPLEGNADQMTDTEPSLVVIAAFAVVLIGFVTGLLNRKQSAAISMLVAAVLALGITYFGMQNLETQLKHQVAGASEQHPQDTSIVSAEDQRQLSESVAQNIIVRREEGYNLTLIALGLAALFSLLTLMQKPKESEAAP